MITAMLMVESYAYLLWVSIQDLKLGAQFASNLLLGRLHGTLILCDSSSPQRLCIGIVLHWVQPQEWVKGVNSMKLPSL